MKILASLSIALFSMTLLTACGGDSDSSGDNNTEVTPETPTEEVTPETPVEEDSACVPVDGVVKVPEQGCTYSDSSLNNGQEITYTCEGTTVKNSIGMSAGNSINLNGISFTCK